MVLGDKTGKKLTWPEVKAICTQADMDRMACLGMVYINSQTVDKSKYAEAAKQFGGSIKPESYQRALWVISKKIADAQNGGSIPNTPAKGSAKKGGKRKTSEIADHDEDDEEETPKKVKKGGKKSEAGGSARSSPVKSEANGDALDLNDIFQ